MASLLASNLGLDRSVHEGQQERVGDGSGGGDSMLPGGPDGGDEGMIDNTEDLLQQLSAAGEIQVYMGKGGQGDKDGQQERGGNGSGGTGEGWILNTYMDGKHP